MNSVLDAMKAAGLSDVAIAAIQQRMTPRPRIRLGETTCPGCGGRIQKYDYACGACSSIKAKRQRKFWQFVIEREEGTGQGRPKPEKARPQQLPASIEREAPAALVPIPEELPPRPEPVLLEWLVTVGWVGRVVAATMPFEAIRLAHRLNEDPPSAGHSILCLGVALDESEYETPDVPAWQSIWEPSW